MSGGLPPRARATREAGLRRGRHEPPPHGTGSGFLFGEVGGEQFSSQRGLCVALAHGRGGRG